ncbi:hypothetical protein FGO68_gene13381 [Halteria grandinella]|uniref:Uncharacterized protein n=1 Tax=Halteria grandinella TaxID=5974 RepID=A0A8J8T8P1_HALGN|nr:hypothetical protein FGO68_gene13381 [Halteria grandinella]
MLHEGLCVVVVEEARVYIVFLVFIGSVKGGCAIFEWVDVPDELSVVIRGIRSIEGIFLIVIQHRRLIPTHFPDFLIEIGLTVFLSKFIQFFPSNDIQLHKLQSILEVVGDSVRCVSHLGKEEFGYHCVELIFNYVCHLKESEHGDCGQTNNHSANGHQGESGLQ